MNRRNFLNGSDLNLPTPYHHDLPEIDPASLKPGENIYDHRLSAAVAELESDSDFILIDCPGSHTRLSQVAHSLADTLITPLNDSFIDFDLLARIDSKGEKILGPSVYSEMVWNARQLRAQAGLKPVERGRSVSLMVHLLSHPELEAGTVPAGVFSDFGRLRRSRRREFYLR